MHGKSSGPLVRSAPQLKDIHVYYEPVVPVESDMDRHGLLLAEGQTTESLQPLHGQKQSSIFIDLLSGFLGDEMIENNGGVIGYYHLGASDNDKNYFICLCKNPSVVSTGQIIPCETLYICEVEKDRTQQEIGSEIDLKALPPRVKPIFSIASSAAIANVWDHRKNSNVTPDIAMLIEQAQEKRTLTDKDFESVECTAALAELPFAKEIPGMLAKLRQSLLSQQSSPNADARQLSTEYTGTSKATTTETPLLPPLQTVTDFKNLVAQAKKINAGDFSSTFIDPELDATLCSLRRQLMIERKFDAPLITEIEKRFPTAASYILACELYIEGFYADDCLTDIYKVENPIHFELLKKLDKQSIFNQIITTISGTKNADYAAAADAIGTSYTKGSKQITDQDSPNDDTSLQAEFYTTRGTTRADSFNNPVYQQIVRTFENDKIKQHQQRHKQTRALPVKINNANEKLVELEDYALSFVCNDEAFAQATIFKTRIKPGTDVKDFKISDLLNETEIETISSTQIRFLQLQLQKLRPAGLNEFNPIKYIYNLTLREAISVLSGEEADKKFSIQQQHNNNDAQRVYNNVLMDIKQLLSKKIIGKLESKHPSFKKNHHAYKLLHNLKNTLTLTQSLTKKGKNESAENQTKALLGDFQENTVNYSLFASSAVPNSPAAIAAMFRKTTAPRAYIIVIQGEAKTLHYVKKNTGVCKQVPILDAHLNKLTLQFNCTELTATPKILNKILPAKSLTQIEKFTGRHHSVAISCEQLPTIISTAKSIDSYISELSTLQVHLAAELRKNLHYDGIEWLTIRPILEEKFSYKIITPAASSSSSSSSALPANIITIGLKQTIDSASNDELLLFACMDEPFAQALINHANLIPSLDQRLAAKENAQPSLFELIQQRWPNLNRPDTPAATTSSSENHPGQSPSIIDQETSLELSSWNSLLEHTKQHDLNTTVPPPYRDAEDFLTTQDFFTHYSDDANQIEFDRHTLDQATDAELFLLFHTSKNIADALLNQPEIDGNSPRKRLYPEISQNFESIYPNLNSAQKAVFFVAQPELRQFNPSLRERISNFIFRTSTELDTLSVSDLARALLNPETQKDNLAFAKIINHDELKTRLIADSTVSAEDLANIYVKFYNPDKGESAASQNQPPVASPDALYNATARLQQDPEFQSKVWTLGTNHALLPGVFHRGIEFVTNPDNFTNQYTGFIGTIQKFGKTLFDRTLKFKNTFFINTAYEQISGYDLALGLLQVNLESADATTKQNAVTAFTRIINDPTLSNRLITCADGKTLAEIYQKFIPLAVDALIKLGTDDRFRHKAWELDAGHTKLRSQVFSHIYAHDKKKYPDSNGKRGHCYSNWDIPEFIFERFITYCEQYEIQKLDLTGTPRQETSLLMLELKKNKDLAIYRIGELIRNLKNDDITAFVNETLFKAKNSSSVVDNVSVNTKVQTNPFMFHKEFLSELYILAPDAFKNLVAQATETNKDAIINAYILRNYIKKGCYSEFIKHGEAPTNDGESTYFDDFVTHSTYPQLLELLNSIPIDNKTLPVKDKTKAAILRAILIKNGQFLLQDHKFADIIYLMLDHSSQTQLNKIKTTAPETYEALDTFVKNHDIHKSPYSTNGPTLYSTARNSNIQPVFRASPTPRQP